MAVRSLPGLCVAVGDNATHLDKANDIDFPAAVEVKNEMALQELRFLLPRDGAEELLAELSALGRSANRRSTGRELARGLAQCLFGRGQAGRVFSLDQGQPHAAASGDQSRADLGGYSSGALGYAEGAQPYYHPPQGLWGLRTWELSRPRYRGQLARGGIRDRAAALRRRRRRPRSL